MLGWIDSVGAMVSECRSGAGAWRTAAEATESCADWRAWARRVLQQFFRTTRLATMKWTADACAWGKAMLENRLIAACRNLVLMWVAREIKMRPCWISPALSREDQRHQWDKNGQDTPLVIAGHDRVALACSPARRSIIVSIAIVLQSKAAEFWASSLYAFMLPILCVVRA